MSEFKFIARPFVVKPSSKKELRTYLGISKHIFNKWLRTIEDELGEPICGLYSPKQVQFIIERFGPSGHLVREVGATLVDNSSKEAAIAHRR